MRAAALCQGRVVYEEDMKPGLLARFLAPFASGTPDAFGVKHPAKMQFAINECGAARVLWAAICAGVAKLFGRTGVFYELTGREASGLRCRACGSEARAACRGAHRDGLPRGASGRSGCAPRAFGADGAAGDSGACRSWAAASGRRIPCDLVVNGACGAMASGRFEGRRMFCAEGALPNRRIRESNDAHMHKCNEARETVCAVKEGLIRLMYGLDKCIYLWKQLICRHPHAEGQKPTVYPKRRLRMNKSCGYEYTQTGNGRRRGRRSRSVP